MQGYLKRLATSGLAYQASSLVAGFLALFTLPLYTHHLTPGAARLRRDAAHGDHPRQHRPALRRRRGVRALLLRRRRRRAPRSPGAPHDVLRRSSPAPWPRWSPSSSPARSRERCWARATRRSWPTASSACGPSPTSRSPTRCCASTSAGATYLIASVQQRRAHRGVDGDAGRRLRRRRARLRRWATTRRRRSCSSGCGSSPCAIASGSTCARRARWGRCCASARPTVPADAAVFALNVVDRAWLLRADSPAAAGLYAVAVKLATLVIVAVRGFQAAWPPLAYSIADEDEARHLYALVTTAYVVVTGPRRRRPDAARALGRAAADRRPLLRRPRGAAVGGAGLGAVRALPRLRHHRGAREGDHAHLPGGGRRAGGQRRRAGPARRPAGPRRARASRCARAYLAMLVAVHLLTRRLFTVPFDWPRLARIVAIVGGISVAGELLLPTSGVDGFALRTLALAADPGRAGARAPAPAPRAGLKRALTICAGCDWRGAAGGRTARGAGVVVGEGISPRHPGASMIRPFRLAALAVASALVLAACGSSGSSGTSSSHPEHAPPPPARRARPPSSPPRRARWARSSSTARAARCTSGTPTTAPMSTCSGACAQAWPPLTTATTPEGERCGQGLAAGHHEARRRLARGHLRRTPALLLRRRQHARPDHRPGQRQLRLRRGGSSRRPARRSRTR